MRTYAFWWRRAQPAEPPPPIDPAALGAIARSANFNPTDDQQIVFAAYRADAIAREVEQRRETGMRHAEHDKIVAEAMAYGWMLVGAGEWTPENVQALQRRLK